MPKVKVKQENINIGQVKRTPFSIRCTKHTGCRRSHASVEHRWIRLRRNDPNVPVSRRKQWTYKEDVPLQQLYKECGGNYARMSAHLPGRSQKSVRRHWLILVEKRKNELESKKKKDVHDPNVPVSMRTEWTYKEDASLQQLYKKYGGKMSEHLPGRSRKSVRIHWLLLMEKRKNELESSNAKVSCNRKPISDTQILSSDQIDDNALSIKLPSSSVGETTDPRANVSHGVATSKDRWSSATTPSSSGKIA
eukprot:scaffold213402_cov48-Attheya_sp.AAC.1